MIDLSPKRVFRFLIFIIIGLSITSIIGQFFEYYTEPNYQEIIDKLNVDGEYTVPSLFSSFNLLFSSVLLGLISRKKWQENDRYTGKWIGLSFIFFYLALDETISLHEQLIHPLRKMLNATGIFYYTWVIPGLMLVVTVTLIYWKFVQDLPPKIKYLFILSGIFYVGGAIGMEMVNGYYSYLYDSEMFVYEILVTIEEFFEKLGVVVFIYALLCYMKLDLPGKEEVGSRE
ncbi:MAG: hypothetical protein F6K40_31680 [Okeania sp. SIO3I5]|uniref:hypothetical protein n=1 Tax=Okeania sp. SIO3I5 TaxID=2607805 RepID=UPI0013BCBE68|nr:hypothetical protein [Okeania sp. SIO3I5]NEQ40545.1 hypothetical protein [Okeania sp. SIO3I5]